MSQPNANTLLADARHILRESVETFAGTTGILVPLLQSHERGQTTWTPEQIAIAKPRLLAAIQRQITTLQEFAGQVEQGL